MISFLHRHVLSVRPPLRLFFALLGSLTFVALVFFTFPQKGLAPIQNPSNTGKTATSTPEPSRATLSKSTTTSPAPTSTLPKATSTPVAASSATRIENPYPFPPHTSDFVTNATRSALVNIFCVSSNAAFRSISGSGVIIDPRGVILTNAHVAQHVLLSSRPEMGITCTIRSGSPAMARWSAQVLYIPPLWVQEHAQDLKTLKPPTTGEHDYALLLITAPIGTSPLAPFPYAPIDTREAIAFPEDEVVIASYPAEFLGSINTQFNLHPISSIASIGQLHTFSTKSADLLSLGGVAEAQSGSSGGPVVNMWGYLVGLITATSEGSTISSRDLRALSLSYINRDLASQTGSTLAQVLAGNIAAYAADFNNRVAPTLISLYSSETLH